jgi:hypothetical protein
MPRKGYRTIELTLKEQIVEALDNLGGTRSGTVSKLILQRQRSSQRDNPVGEVESAESTDSPEILIAHITEKFPDFTRQQIIDLITDALFYLK